MMLAEGDVCKEGLDDRVKLYCVIKVSQFGYF